MFSSGWVVLARIESAIKNFFKSWQIYVTISPLQVIADHVRPHPKRCRVFCYFATQHPDDAESKQNQDIILDGLCNSIWNNSQYLLSVSKFLAWILPASIANAVATPA